MMKACWHCGVPVHVENTGFHVCLVGESLADAMRRVTEEVQNEISKIPEGEDAKRAQEEGE